ncbi:GspH/FimT family pseudopilin [Polaromonas sp. CT11-55]|uniref:GspH/FimT family pseudopilin n=1 Tax=Polaromonas sp. CT11-55 TaxID=3243045 RepID=UPI0039A457BB
MNLQHQAAAAPAATTPQRLDNAPLQAAPPAGTRRLSTCPLPRGLTLVELLVALAIIAIVAGFAIPSFLGLVASTRVSATVNAFVADTHYARGEAIRRGKTVTICRSADPVAHPPKCSSGNGAAVGGWREGWFVFTDEDSDGAFDSGTDTVMRIQEAFANAGSFLAVNHAGSPVNNRNYISFDATGRAVGLQARWLVQAEGALSTNSSYTRTLCMNMGGRVRVQAGEAPCA